MPKLSVLLCCAFADEVLFNIVEETSTQDSWGKLETLSMTKY